MKFWREVKGFSCILYFVGLHPRANLSRAKLRVLDFLPIVLHMAFVAFAGALCVYAQSQLSRFRVIVDTVATYLLVGSECMLHLTVVVQIVLHRENVKELYRQYETILHHLNSRSKRPIRFDGFIRTFRRLSAAILALFMFTLFIRKIIYHKAANLPLETGLLMLQFASSLVQLRTIVHVSLTNFFYMIATKQMRVRVPVVLTIGSLQGGSAAELRHLKFFHFKLWEVAKIINAIYGWSTLAIILRNYFEVFYSVLTVYWISVYSTSALSVWYMLREFHKPPKILEKDM